MKELHVKIGLSSLNQDPLDFKRNTQRIISSIEECKKLKCSIRVGAELEVCGYSCYDHLGEYDTVYHCWQAIAEILRSGVTKGIVCDIGCPLLHKAALYNCRVILYDSMVVAIRPKMIMADGDNYFESRWFATWKQNNKIDDFVLPIYIQEVTGQKIVPIGIFIINFNDTRLAYQICEEAWISRNPMIEAALDGAEIFVNPSASYVQRGKLKRKIQMITQFTERHGGCYIYVNTKGSSGDRVYFQGGCLFSENGRIKYLSQLNSLDECQLTTVIVNINSIRSFRMSNKSFQKESNCTNKIPRVSIDLNVAVCDEEYIVDGPKHQKNLARLMDIYMIPHVTFQPSLFLWQYLKKTKARGFFLALSGGLDSCSVAIIVYNMCYIVYEEICKMKQKQKTLEELRKIVRDSTYYPQSAKEICKKIFYTCYMGTENSSKQTKKRAEKIAKILGINHRSIQFDNIYKAFRDQGKKSTGLDLKFRAEGGTDNTDLCLQNIQSRSRMVLSYMFAAMELQIHSKDGFLLVLGSSNLDESLRGYFTKYDCSSADYNPIGSFSKCRLRQFLSWNRQFHNFEFIEEIIEAKPTAQLRPLQNGQTVQTDQEDMGFTYQELKTFGQLRKNQKLGPVSMFDRLLSMRKFDTVRRLAQKVKQFFVYYGKNRHKMTTITPSFHYDPEGCDDNRFDMRPFIYHTDWSDQFKQIDMKMQQFINLHPSAETHEKRTLTRTLSYL